MGDTNEIVKELSATSTTIPPCATMCAGESECGCCGQALCIASSVCASNIPTATSSISATIPANSCITKIYASMPNAPTKAKYILIEIKNGAGTTIFCHGVPNTGNNDTEFDTTLVQPLCVGGPNPATATVTPLDQNNTAVSEILTLTVVYCTNCC